MILIRETFASTKIESVGIQWNLQNKNYNWTKIAKAIRFNKAQEEK